MTQIDERLAQLREELGTCPKNRRESIRNAIISLEISKASRTSS